MVWLDAIDLRQAPARGRLTLSCSSSGMSRLRINLEKHIHPIPRPRTNLNHGTPDRHADDLAPSYTAGDTALEKGDDAHLGGGLDLGADGGPELAEEGVAEGVEGEEGGVAAVGEEGADGEGDVSRGDGHEEPGLDEVRPAVLDGGPYCGHCEGVGYGQCLFSHWRFDELLTDLSLDSEGGYMSSLSVRARL